VVWLFVAIGAKREFGVAQLDLQRGEVLPQVNERGVRGIGASRLQET
jgi:hypothetical protein